MARRMGTKLSPWGVRVYSTRGGTSPKSVRVRKPSSTSSLSCLESVDSDMFPMQCRAPPGQREQILAALDAVISDFGEERLRRYRVNLRHLWEVREKVPTWVICEKGAEDAS